MGIRKTSIQILVFLTMTGSLTAQTTSGSLRTRAENWSWFEHPGGDGSYTYAAALLRAAVSDQKPRLSWRVEVAVPLLVGLPDDAVAPPPGGQLGAGASYWQANDSSQNVVGIFLKQAFVRFGKPQREGGHSARVGRFEFIEGTELTPTHATLAALKRERINHRLIGNFGWTHVQRSFDGVQYGFDKPNLNATVMAFRPTQGVFNASGWRELDIGVAYASLNRTWKFGDGRIFFSGYHDYRDDPLPLKIDNRPAIARAADTDAIDVASVGAHYLHAVPTKGGNLDVLLWGILQTGNWGTLDHRAYGYSVEAGWQPAVKEVQPWLRIGYTSTSGDDDATDDKHATFFQLLPTPRWYARFPFYNMMNIRDLFVSLTLRPSARITFRTEVHDLALSEANDLWYAGGGAFEEGTFGYAGRPAGGASRLATTYDLSGDFRVNNWLSVNAYIAFARGNAVMQNIYADDNASLKYLEVELRR